jgi:hypothetical protein
MLWNNSKLLKYCDGYGVCYATASKLHVTSLKQCGGYSVCYATASKVRVTSDESIASQRLGIPRQPNFLNPQQP